MNTVAPNYLRIASSILKTNESIPPDIAVANRYLSLHRRRRILNRGVTEAEMALRLGNPLSEIEFSVPLSVAGADSLALVIGEAYSKQGIPIALELDSKGHHRGTSIDATRRMLIDKDYPLGTREIFEQYKLYVGACPALLGQHPIRKYARIPGLLNRLFIQRKHLEERLAQIVLGYDPSTPRFTMIVSSARVVEILREKTSQTILIGSGTAGAIGGAGIERIWSGGQGMATVYRQQLVFLCNEAQGHPIGMQFDLKGWIGWVAKDKLPKTCWEFNFPEKENQ